MTQEEFIEKSPLYTQYGSERYDPPASVSLSCSTCAKETTWGQVNDHDLYNTCGLTGHIVTYRCGLCEKHRVTVVIRQFNSSGKGKVQKIGQFPAQSIEIASDLEKRLGSDAALYKNALICRNTNFGIELMAYLRRVVENKTNDLIEVLAEQAESYDVDAGRSCQVASGEGRPP